MNSIYLISHPNSSVLCEIESAIVVADSIKNAREIHPGRGWTSSSDSYPDWVMTPEEVSVTKLGIAARSLPQGVIITSLSTK